MKKILKSLKNYLKPQRKSTSLSDNLTYPQFCLEASNDKNKFNDFRRNQAYMKILEHVTQKLGNEYLDIISKDDSLMANIANFKKNDIYGMPIMYTYPVVGTISPTTLRYIKVLMDHKKYFGTLDDLSICEIGVGYGGQCRIINDYYNPLSYTLVDLSEVLSLTEKYLGNYSLNSSIQYKTMYDLSPSSYDLVISNYAFSELPRSIQDIYLEKIILNSKKGYMTYNQITPNSYMSYKPDELVTYIPGAKIINENPLTHPYNCIIVWG